jgi:hypothetical protein
MRANAPEATRRGHREYRAVSVGDVPRGGPPVAGNSGCPERNRKELRTGHSRMSVARPKWCWHEAAAPANHLAFTRELGHTAMGTGRTGASSEVKGDVSQRVVDGGPP